MGLRWFRTYVGAPRKILYKLLLRGSFICSHPGSVLGLIKLLVKLNAWSVVAWVKQLVPPPPHLLAEWEENDDACKKESLKEKFCC